MTITRWENCYNSSWKGLITDASFAHPAKFARGLIERIYDHCLAQGYLQRGDLVADVFGGIGTGGITAAYRGLNWSGCELEPKFVALAQENFKLHRHGWSAVRGGSATIIQGDSRKFDEHVSGIVSSPPYADSLRGVVYNGIDCEKLSEGGRGANSQAMSKEGYGESNGQISALRTGAVDSVISSPPFTQGYQGGGGINKNGYTARPDLGTDWVGKRTYQGQGGDRTAGNIETLKEGAVQGVIASPPYSDIAAGAGGLNTKPAKHPGQQSGRKAESASQDTDQKYGKSNGQISQLKGGSVELITKYENDMGMAGGILRGRGMHNMVRGRKSGASERDEGARARSGNNNRPKGEAATGTDSRLSEFGGNAGGAPLLEKTISEPMEGKDQRVLGSTIQPGGGESVFPESHSPAASCQKSEGAGSDRESKNAASRQAELRNEAFDRADVGCGSDSEIHCGTSKFGSDEDRSRVAGDGETYWEAVLEVYRSCFKCIKPGGYIILVVKDYIKGGKRVRLCDDTMRLLEHIGFEPLERIHAMLVTETVENGLFGEEKTKRQRKSFFRRLYEAKLPEIDERRIDHEEVLICRRP